MWAAWSLRALLKMAANIFRWYSYASISEGWGLLTTFSRARLSDVSGKEVSRAISRIR